MVSHSLERFLISNFDLCLTNICMKGEPTVKQPVHMSDLVTGIMNSLYDPAAVGQTYEGVGCQRLTQAELLTYMYALTTRTKEDGTFKIAELMLDPATMARAFMIGKSPFGTVGTFHQYNLDRLERDSLSDTSEGYPDLTELGVKLRTLESQMPWEVSPMDLYSYYHYETVDEMPTARLPKLVSFEEERRIEAKRAGGPIEVAVKSVVPAGLL